MLVGSSTGTALHAALTVAQELNEDAVVVVLLCDTGRNYISKLYNEDWLREHGLLDESPGEERHIAPPRDEEPKGVGGG